jgi:hypothetical protein
MEALDWASLAGKGVGLWSAATRMFFVSSSDHKLKVDVVDEIEALIHDSLQCQSSLDKSIREFDSGSGSPSSGVNGTSHSEFEHVPTPHSPQGHCEEDWGVYYDNDQLPSFSD